MTLFRLRCCFYSMIRTQIQMPDRLHHEIQRVAEQQEWSISEVIRRAAEAYVARFPADKGTEPTPWWEAPAIRGAWLVESPEAVHRIVLEDAERSGPAL